MALNKIPTFQDVKDWANANFTSLSEVNNNADVPNADYADSAGDADTVGGKPPSELGSQLSVYRSTRNISSRSRGAFTPSSEAGFSEDANVVSVNAYVKEVTSGDSDIDVFNSSTNHGFDNHSYTHSFVSYGWHGSDKPYGNLRMGYEGVVGEFGDSFSADIEFVYLVDE